MQWAKGPTDKKINYYNQIHVKKKKTKPLFQYWLQVLKGSLNLSKHKSNANNMQNTDIQKGM